MPKQSTNRECFCLGESLSFLFLLFRIGLLKQKTKASKGNNNPMEAKYRYLLINHHNNELQEVKGKVDGFAEISRETALDKYSYENVKSIEI